MSALDGFVGRLENGDDPTNVLLSLVMHVGMSVADAIDGIEQGALTDTQRAAVVDAVASAVFAYVDSLIDSLEGE